MAVGGGLMKSKDPGIMYLWSVLNYESDISDAIAILDDELLEIAQNGITESELERAKNRVEFDYYQSLSTFLQKSFMLGYYYTTTGNWECLNNYIKKAREVTANDVKRVAAEYLRKSNSNTVILQPYNESEDDSNID